MEFNGEIRSSCRQLIQIVSRKKVTEERLNAIIFQLRDCLDYASVFLLIYENISLHSLIVYIME